MKTIILAGGVGTRFAEETDVRPGSGMSNWTATASPSRRSRRSARAGSTADSSCRVRVFDYIEREKMQFQREPLERLAADGQLMACRHTLFWQWMDTLRDKDLLQQLWDTDNAPWKVWS